MQNSAVQSRQTRFKRILFFVLHQLISTIGVVAISGVLCFSFVAILHTWYPSLTSRQASWLLTEVPGFPFQILTGLVAGFLLARITRTRSVLLVWIVPLLFLCFGALIVVHPTSSTLAHLFGDACGPADHCFDQILFTLPFLASLAYTVGAVLGRSQFHKPPVEKVGMVPSADPGQSQPRKS
jgi:hypothetical protein